MNKNFTEDQAGQPICEEDIAHPSNHKYSSVHDPVIKEKSNARVPTYGLCGRCMKRVGPVGRGCRNCNPLNERANPIYEIVMLESPERFFVDMLTVADFANLEVETCKADYEYLWHRDPVFGVRDRTFFIGIIARKKNEGIEDFDTRRSSILEDRLALERLLSEN